VKPELGVRVWARKSLPIFRVVLGATWADFRTEREVRGLKTELVMGFLRFFSGGAKFTAKKYRKREVIVSNES
jgi:hypothetical protein